jgi:demethylsterigmatocystin 6-O-methyltransferase
MTDQVDRKETEAAGIKVMAHDFFTPQTIKCAKVYYFRTVLHDWSDDNCRTILKHTREAMAADSVVVVDEIVLPLTGATLKQMNSDLTMMAIIGAMERTREQWAGLLESSGLRVRDVWIYDEQSQNGIIVGVPV